MSGFVNFLELEHGKWYKIKKKMRTRGLVDCWTLVQPSQIFYTQKNISLRFHNGKRVHAKNIHPSWTLRVTQAPNGQWFTLNNRLLFAHKMGNLPKDDSDDVNYLTGILLKPILVQVLPFEEVKEVFDRKFTSRDNGNTCYLFDREWKRQNKDWVCSKWVNREAFELFIENPVDPRLGPPQTAFVRNMKVLQSLLEVMVVVLAVLSAFSQCAAELH